MISTLLWVGFLSLTYLASAQQAPTCAPCERAIALLSQCGLPPLSTDYHTFTGPTTERNVSQAPDFFNFHVDGPRTYILANYTSAQCICSDVEDVSTCAQDCTVLGDGFTDGTPEYNQYQMATTYVSDCAEFGYYKNSTQAYPSTTITSLPVATAPPTEEPPHCAACDVLASQLTQCNSTSADGATYPPLDSYSGAAKVLHLGDLIQARSYLVNRTMGECVCTLPVLRRFAACEDCAATMGSVVDGYAEDCRLLGYFSDSQVVLPSDDTPSSASSVASSTISSTATSSSGTATSSAIAKSEAGSTHRAFKGIGCTFLWFWLSVGLL